MILSSPVWAFLISCPCLSSVCLAEGSLCAWAVFVLANLLLFRRLTPVGQWKDWQDLKMWRTVLSCPTPAGRKEWGLLAGSVWQATGDGLSGGTSRPHKSTLHFTCKWSQKIPLCLWTELCKTLKSQEEPWQRLICMCWEIHTATWGHMYGQNNSGISNSDQCRVLIKGLRHWFNILCCRAPWLGRTNRYF